MEVAILCGGEGTRLRPLTYAVPKPLLPLGPKPILEVVITRMKEQGFRAFYLMVNYKAEMIRSYFGDGSSFGIELEYIDEQYPRGTAGPLSVLKSRISSPLVVMNSDLLTNLRFAGLMQFHQQQDSDLTVALKKLERRLAYGIVDVSDDMVISGFEEKPHLTFLINSGIYVLSPEVLSLIPDSGRFLMTDLIEKAIEAGKRVTGYEFTETWVDIGRLDNYMRTLGDLENGLESDTEMVFMREDRVNSQSPGS